MGREKKNPPATLAGSAAVLRHRKAVREPGAFTSTNPLPPDLVAKPALPVIKSKHKTIIQYIENSDKRSKLELSVTTDRNPPPGFEFVPIGNPALTNKCKDLSREKRAMIFIVSPTRDVAKPLALHMNRVGHHVRQAIVQEAEHNLGYFQNPRSAPADDLPEPIPESQTAINAQADAAIRDLFPRIPHPDRQIIIDHAFRKGSTFKGDPVVGLSSGLPLSRRVQLAVLAHIRHCHTRYDQLLKETTYLNARRLVEPLCLDILVKWRGDEENGRDDLDFILKEVVVISDDEDEEDEDPHASSGESSSSSSPDQSDSPRIIPGLNLLAALPRQAVPAPGHANAAPAAPKSTPRNGYGGVSKHKRARSGVAQRGFKRYQAAWEQAVSRRREVESSEAQVHHPIPAPSPPPPHPPHPGHPVSVAPDAAHAPPLDARPPFGFQDIVEPRPEFYWSRPQWPDGLYPASPMSSVAGHPAPTSSEHTSRSGSAFLPAQDASRREPSAAAPAPPYPYQDMLVPSIESPSPASSSRPVTRQASYHERTAFDQAPDHPHPRYASSPRSQPSPVFAGREDGRFAMAPEPHGHAGTLPGGHHPHPHSRPARVVSVQDVPCWPPPAARPRDPHPRPPSPPWTRPLAAATDPPHGPARSLRERHQPRVAGGYGNQDRPIVIEDFPPKAIVESPVELWRVLPPSENFRPLWLPRNTVNVGGAAGKPAAVERKPQPTTEPLLMKEPVVVPRYAAPVPAAATTPSTVTEDYAFMPRDPNPFEPRAHPGREPVPWGAGADVPSRFVYERPLAPAHEGHYHSLEAGVPHLERESPRGDGVQHEHRHSPRPPYRPPQYQPPSGKPFSSDIPDQQDLQREELRKYGVIVLD